MQVSNDRQFAGNKKHGEFILKRFEYRLKEIVIPRMPSFIETYHLTVLGFVFSLFILLFSYFAKENVHWFWGVSVMIIFQHLADLFDGALGRYRNTGLIKWGYYMDHFFDYVFFCTIFIGYSLHVPVESFLLVVGCFAVLVGYMVNSFLSFAVTNTFRVYYYGIGPSEMRIVVIIFNAVLVFVGTELIAKGLPYIFWVCLVSLAVVLFRSQREIWKMDMKDKKDGKQRVCKEWLG